MLTAVIIWVFPGPVYSGILLLYSGKQSTVRAFFFLVSAMAFYFVVLFLISSGPGMTKGTPYQLLAVGGLSFVGLILLYNIFLLKGRGHMRWMRLLWTGTKASLPAGVACWVVQLFYKPDLEHGPFFYVGVLSLFPLWQYLFSQQVLAMAASIPPAPRVADLVPASKDC